jgi:hypothetical protein
MTLEPSRPASGARWLGRPAVLTRTVLAAFSYRVHGQELHVQRKHWLPCRSGASERLLRMAALRKRMSRERMPGCGRRESYAHGTSQYLSPSTRDAAGHYGPHGRSTSGWLDRALVQSDPGIVNVKTDPMFAGLRGDSRYKSVLRKMNLPE